MLGRPFSILFPSKVGGVYVDSSPLKPKGGGLDRDTRKNPRSPSFPGPTGQCGGVSFLTPFLKGSMMFHA